MSKYKERTTDEDNDIIAWIIEEVLGATSPETSVTKNQIVDKGIELGETFSYPRGRADGHPWGPRLTRIVGAGKPELVGDCERTYVHRVKRISGESSHKAYHYYVDRSKIHNSGRQVTLDSMSQYNGAGRYNENDYQKVIDIPKGKAPNIPTLHHSELLHTSKGDISLDSILSSEESFNNAYSAWMNIDVNVAEIIKSRWEDMNCNVCESSL